MSHIWPELSKIIPTVLLVSKALQLLMQYSCLFVLSNIQKKFSKFESFACASHGTIFDAQTNF